MLIMIVALMMMMLLLLMINIRQAGAPRRLVPLTKKRSAQSLAEEPLTFSPDPRCRPPSTVLVAVVVSSVAAVAATGAGRLRLWSQRELVGRRDGREGGA
jgi:hypothetical protein